MKAILSVLIFIVVYILIASEKLHKTVAAILGAAVVLFLHLVTFEQAAHAVDLNVIFLLVGMMTCVHILAKTGFFEWTAISVAKLARGNPLYILIFLLTVTALLSMVLDNVTTVVLLVPVTILIMQLLEINPVPCVILEAIASNVGGTATLIGDPPNIIIGSSAKLSFNDFLFQLTPVITLVYLAFAGTIFLFFQKRCRVPDNIKIRVMEAIPELAIIDRPNMHRALIILGFIFVGFFLHSTINVEPGIIALVGGMVMLAVCKAESDATLMKVEWSAIFFFVGMFMMISALEVNGVVDALGSFIFRVAGKDLFLLTMIILWGSAFISAIIDNIPYVIAMVPLIKDFLQHYSTSGALTPNVEQFLTQHTLWWALALGACLGGNATLIGASANVVSAHISEKNGYRITFMQFTKYGLPLMIQSMIICSIYIWFRYFR
jgi:Na+/H+ antiporter NhaD/arsenite permease-like protein